jgi:hypothetical protein
MNIFSTNPSLLRVILLIAFSVSLCGCQLMAKKTSDDSNSIKIVEKEHSSYGNYYLWIKSLNNDELIAEIEKQQLKQSKGNQAAEYNLLLLHSLPNSPIHNPYIAKEKLNKQTSPQHFNVADLAFIVMLKDQLNQQLLILNRLIDKDKTNTESQKQLEVQQQSIEQLKERTEKLQQQILQLKNIERSINDHGTQL